MCAAFSAIERNEKSEAKCGEAANAKQPAGWPARRLACGWRLASAIGRPAGSIDCWKPAYIKHGALGWKAIYSRSWLAASWQAASQLRLAMALSAKLTAPAALPAQPAGNGAWKLAIGYLYSPSSCSSYLRFFSSCSLGSWLASAKLSSSAEM